MKNPAYLRNFRVLKNIPEVIWVLSKAVHYDRPAPDEIIADIDALRTFSKKIIDRRKATAAQILAHVLSAESVVVEVSRAGHPHGVPSRRIHQLCIFI